MTSTLQNFAWVLDGELAGLAYPQSEGALEELVSLDFRSLLSLSDDAPDCCGTGLVHLHCPLPDFQRIPLEKLKRATTFLACAPTPIAVHCQGGIGRTGVVLACRLVELGDHSSAQAIQMVREKRPDSIDDIELERSVHDFEADLEPIHFRIHETPRNLAAASWRDTIVFGSERPGYAQTGDIDEGAVGEWISFMQDQGIRQVVCLLDDSQLSYYTKPLIDQYRESFEAVTWAPIEDYHLPDPQVLKEALQALNKALEKKTPVVVHCSAGVGRTGLVLAAWLRKRYGLAAGQAISEVETFARYFGADRCPTEAGEGVRKFLASLEQRI